MIPVFESSGQVAASSSFHVERNLGLINARILGGNEARGDFLAFIDAHVFGESAMAQHAIPLPHRGSSGR